MSRWRYGVLFALTFWLTSCYWSQYFGMEDEAVLVHGAQRLCEGQIPYRDWETRHTPGTYCLVAPFLGLLGTDPLTVRGLMSGAAALIGVFLYAIGRRCGLSGWTAYLPWFLWTTAGLMDFPILSYHWVASIFTLGCVYWTVRWGDGEGAGAARALGICASLAFWCLQSEGLAAVLMITLVGLTSRPRALGVLLRWLVGSSLLLWLPFLPWLGEVVQENLLDMLWHVPYNRYAYSWAPLREMAQGWLHLSPAENPWVWGAAFSHWLVNAGRYGGFYLLILIYLGMSWRRELRLRHLGLCALAWSLAVGNRQTISYLAFASPIWFLVLGLTISRLPRNWARALSLSLMGLEAVGFGCRSYYYKTACRFPVTTRSGVYWTADSSEAEAMRVVRQWLDASMPPGTTVLGYPYFCTLYSLEGLKNPIRQPVLTPFLYADADFEACRQALRDQQVPWILHRAISPEVQQISYGIPAEQYAAVSRQKLALLTQDYQLVAGNEQLGLYQRKLLP